MASKIPVIEIFGPTIQGEGMVIGKKTMFVRTAGCDYACSWCDSAFTWNGEERDRIALMTADEIFRKLKETAGENFSHVTISGGNPLLLKGLGELIELLKQHHIRTAVETQGSRWQDWLTDVDDITISPKPPSSGMRTNFDRLDLMVGKLTHSGSRLCLKVVVFDEKDFDYAKTIHKRFPLVSFYLQVGNPDIISPDRDQLSSMLIQKYQWLIDLTLNAEEMNDAYVLPQLHTLVWGNKRKV
ncbi:7-carboxy-7-deazaguanine synthase QueE [Heyndrickxia acidiproducens]|jgi:7-carboxy-7-deazaguanine synthase|uniref:7-carboxy-7-deazaguanine synthase QueE n=1 Tax=Heyndrickxia acidiproducens TaxID=1121084 RepID=UPI000370A1B1|nr:7-carboxy-7-deazaguanine synthase QueE [Heyndrickxia acidiproducens]